MLLDERHRAAHARVVAGRKPTSGMSERARVGEAAIVRLDERVERSDRRRFAQTSSWIASRSVAPPVERPVEVELLGALHGAVERDPRHHLRMREVLRRAAHLPDSLVGLLATSSRAGRAAPSEGASASAVSASAADAAPGGARPSPRRRRRAGAARGRRCRCGPASSSRIPAARGPPTRQSSRSPATPYMICSCVGLPGRGAQQPVAPGRRLAEVAGVHQREQRAAWRRAASSSDSPSCARRRSARAGTSSAPRRCRRSARR